MLGWSRAKVAVVAPMIGAGRTAGGDRPVCEFVDRVVDGKAFGRSLSGSQPRYLRPRRCRSRVSRTIVAPIAFLVSLTIGFTALAGPISRLTTQAAEQLLDRNAYVRAVLGEGVPHVAR